MSRRAATAGAIAVEAGQIYRCRRAGGPPRYVRVERVHRSSARTPTASIVELSRAGKPKRGGIRTTTTATWRDGAWRLRSGYELVSI